MHPATIELMHDQVRTIYRAATGGELREGDESSELDQLPLPGDIERRFVELDALVRRNPELGQRVPPFSFTPLVNVIDAGPDILVEVAAPGVDANDVDVKVTDHGLYVFGMRRGESRADGTDYVRAEIPRGPFGRALELPCAVQSEPHIDARSGLIRIRLRKA